MVRSGCVIRVDERSDGHLPTLASLFAAAASHRSLRGAMEGHLAAADPERMVSFAQNLADVHREINVELGAILLRLGDVFVEASRVDDVIDRRSTTWAEEAIVEVLADDDVVGPDFREQEHAASDLGVAQQGGTGHGVVPVAVDPFERQDGSKAAGAQPSHRDAGTPRIGQPDE